MHPAQAPRVCWRLQTDQANTRRAGDSRPRPAVAAAPTQHVAAAAARSSELQTGFRHPADRAGGPTGRTPPYAGVIETGPQLRRPYCGRGYSLAGRTQRLLCRDCHQRAGYEPDQSVVASTTPQRIALDDSRKLLPGSHKALIRILQRLVRRTSGAGVQSPDRLPVHWATSSIRDWLAPAPLDSPAPMAP